MSGGTLLALYAKGIQDTLLTGAAEITWWKQATRQYSAFSTEFMSATGSGTANFGGKVSFVIPKSGDLLHRVFVQTNLPAVSNSGGEKVCWTRNVGLFLLKTVDFLIGGQRIDKLYSQWLHLWSEFTLSKDHEPGFYQSIGNTAALTDTDATSCAATELNIPLPFTFARHSGSAIPLVSIPFHELKIEIEFEKFENLIVTSDGNLPSSGVGVLGNTQLFCEYVFLDENERNMFAQNEHTYPIEVVQFSGEESFAASTIKTRLSFNHPTKFLVIAAQLDANISSGRNRLADFTANGGGSSPYAGSSPITNVLLQLNGNDKQTKLSSNFYTNLTSFYSFARTPSTGIVLYPFALKCLDLQPSGSVNFSRIDSAQLVLDMASNASCKLYIFAFSYNFLSIKSGLAGLKFAA